MPLATPRLKPGRPSRTVSGLKRGIDIVGSTAGLVVLLPVFIVIAIFIKLDSPGPVFFRQERVGLADRRFRIWKFRTMVVGASRAGTALTVNADKRITSFGSFLRRTKLDELPQLLNVLVGDMSIVGPRPEVPEFMAFYGPDQRAVMVSMRPGMTDFAAILFRDESSLLGQDGDPVEAYRRKIMPLKFVQYERYHRESGVLTDFRIVAATLLLLVIGRCPRWLGIEHDLHLTDSSAVMKRPPDACSSPSSNMVRGQ
jgi:lipopolysaccharide/colanic/teichoic acid biosynthesis glycosyltransferase